MGKSCGFLFSLNIGLEAFKLFAIFQKNNLNFFMM
jgi:hypothetical protein